MDTVLDSADNVQSPMNSTAITPSTTSPASITELKSIIVFTPFLLNCADTYLNGLSKQTE